KMGNNGRMEASAVMLVKKKIGIGGHWKFIPQDNGLYRIQNKASKMYLANYGKTNKGSVIRQTDVPGAGALWRIVQLQGGSILIQNNLSLLFIGIATDYNKTPLIQAKALSARIAWLPEEVIVNKGLPKNTNIVAFRPRNKGTIGRAFVTSKGEITIEGVKPRIGQRIYFFRQQLAAADKEGISFNPKRPLVCGQTYLIRKVLPKIMLNTPLPTMRNKKKQTFMFVVEVF
ncbi:MAG: RICIN domain-containing protein, partial [Bacteroidota bacterium]